MAQELWQRCGVTCCIKRAKIGQFHSSSDFKIWQGRREQDSDELVVKIRQFGVKVLASYLEPHML